MSTVLRLKQARALLADGGWSGPDVEPFCVVKGRGVRLNPRHPSLALDPDGVVEEFAPLWIECDSYCVLVPGEKEVAQYSVLGALFRVGLGFEQYDLIERVVQPPNGIDNWLKASERVTSHIMETFTKAIAQSKKGERRG